MARPPLIQGARHRGRILTTSQSPQYARDVLASLGFGPRIQVWTNPAELARDWREPVRADQPPYLTNFFEADWLIPAYEIPTKNPSKPSAAEIQAGAPDWFLYDLGAYCWTDPTWEAPPHGLALCDDAKAPPWQGPPPIDGTPPVGDNQPPKPAGSSAWLMVLGAAVVAVPLGLLIMRAHARPAPRSARTGATRVSSPGARRSARA